MYACMHAYVFVCMSISTCFTSMQICVYVCMCVCVSVRVGLCVYVYIQIGSVLLYLIRMRSAPILHILALSMNERVVCLCVLVVFLLGVMTLRSTTVILRHPATHKLCRNNIDASLNA